MVPVVHAFSRVFFHMDMVNSNIFSVSAGKPHQHTSPQTYWVLVLRYLVTFGQVGVKIIFAGKRVVQINGAIAGQTHFYRVSNHLAIDAWQGSGVTQRYRAYVAVWPGAKTRRV